MADEDWKQQVYERLVDSWNESNDSWPLTKIIENFPSSLKKSEVRALLEQDKHFRFLILDDSVFPFVCNEDIEQKEIRYFAELLFLRVTRGNTPVIGVTTFRNIVKRINKDYPDSYVDFILEFIAKDNRFIIEGKKNQVQSISLNPSLEKKTADTAPTSAAPRKAVAVPKVPDEKPLINCFHDFSYYFKHKVWSLAVIREIIGKGYLKLENSIRSNRLYFYFFNEDAICTYDDDLSEVLATIIFGKLLYTDQSQVSLLEVTEELKKLDRRKQLQFSDTAIDAILAHAPLRFFRKGKGSVGYFALSGDKALLLSQQDRVNVEDFPALLLDYLSHVLTTVTNWEKSISFKQLFEHYPIFTFHCQSWQRLLSIDTRFSVSPDGIITVLPFAITKQNDVASAVATSPKKPNGIDRKEKPVKESGHKETGSTNNSDWEELKKDIFQWLRSQTEDYPEGMPYAELFARYPSISKRNIKSILGLDEQLRFILLKEKVFPFVATSKSQPLFEKAAYYLYHLMKPLSPPSLPLNTVANTLLQSSERVKKQEINSFMEFLPHVDVLEIVGPAGREKLAVRSNAKGEKSKKSRVELTHSDTQPLSSKGTNGIAPVSELLDRMQPSSTTITNGTSLDHTTKEEKIRAKREKAMKLQVIQQHEDMAIHHPMKQTPLSPHQQQQRQQQPFPTQVEEYLTIAKVMDMSATANRYQNFENEIPYESLCLHPERPFNALLFQQESYQSLSRLLAVVGMRSNSSPRNLVVLDQNPELFLTNCVSLQGRVVIFVSPLIFFEAQQQYRHRANVTVKPFLLSWSAFTVKTLLTFLNLDIAAASTSLRRDADYALIRFLSTYSYRLDGHGDGRLPPFSEFLSLFMTHYQGEKQRIVFLLETFVRESESNRKFWSEKEEITVEGGGGRWEITEESAESAIHIINLSDHYGLLSPQDMEGVYCYHLSQFMTTKAASQNPPEALHVDNIVVLNDLSVSLEECSHSRQLYLHKTRLREMLETASLHHTSVLIRQSSLPTALDPLLLSSLDFTIVSSLSFASVARHWQSYIERMLNYTGSPSINGSTLVVMNFRSLNMFLLRSAAGMQLIDQLSLPIDY